MSNGSPHFFLHVRAHKQMLLSTCNQSGALRVRMSYMILFRVVLHHQVIDFITSHSSQTCKTTVKTNHFINHWPMHTCTQNIGFQTTKITVTTSQKVGGRGRMRAEVETERHTATPCPLVLSRYPVLPINTAVYQHVNINNKTLKSANL